MFGFTSPLIIWKSSIWNKGSRFVFSLVFSCLSMSLPMIILKSYSFSLFSLNSLLCLSWIYLLALLMIHRLSRWIIFWRRAWDFASAPVGRICRLSPTHSAGSDRSLPKSPLDFPATFAPCRVLVPRLGQKIKIPPHWVVFLFWRRAWDSNPRGFNTLLAFQASSLATRSTLHRPECHSRHI